MSRSLRTHLFALIVVVLVPISAFAVVLATRLADHRREDVRSAMTHVARSIALALDREVEGSIAALTALAASPLLDGGDLTTFHRLAAEVQATQYWNAVILADLPGRQVLNTLKPLGTALPARASLEAHRRAVATRQPAISDLFVGALVGRPVVTIEVPVIRNGAVKYVLIGSLELDAAGRLLKETTLPTEWAAAILDTRRVTIARSRDAELWIGKPPSPLKQNIPHGAPSGWVEGADRDGADSVGAFATSRVSGWTVLIATPRQVLDAPARAALRTSVGGVLATMLLALGLAALVSRRLSAPVRALTLAARTLGDGGRPAPVPHQVTELDQVAAAIDQAATLLAERARQRDQSAAALNAQRQQLTLVTDTLPALVAYVDRDERYRFSNRGHEEWFGWSRAELRGHTLHEVLGDELYAVVRPHVEDALAGRSVTFETTVPYRLGGERAIRATYVPDVEDGGSVRGFVAFIIDITDRRRAEARLAVLGDIGRSITASLELDIVLQRVVDGARELTASDLAAIFLAEGAGDVMVPRYRAGGPRGEGYDALRVVRGRGAGGIVLATGRPFRTEDYAHDSQISGDYRHVTEQSPVVALMVVPIVLRDRIEGLLYVGNQSRRTFTDDDEAICLRLAEHAAIAMHNAGLFAKEQAARREAETANRMKDEFLATLSHELRTPLNAVLGWARMLRTAPLDGERQRKALETIERNAAAQTRLIEDMLDVSRIVSGKLRLQRIPLDLTTVVTSAVEVVRPAAESKHIALDLSVPPSTPLIGDADRLQQVVWNLLANAVKFTPPSGRVRLCLDRTRDQVRLVVSDTGVGIEPHVLPRIFDRFWQAERRGSLAGLGLGLAIVKHLVEAHGGQVSAASAGPGQGATFTVTLPAAPLEDRDLEPRPTHVMGGLETSPEPPTRPVPSRETPAGPRDDDSVTSATTMRDTPGRAGGRLARPVAPLARPRLDGLRVLLVEDEPDARDLLVMALERSGAQVIATRSVAEALGVFTEQRPAVIVSDIAMADASGYDLVQEIRRADRPRVPAVAVTAYARAEDRTRAFAAGFDAHVAKPVDTDELIRVVAKLVGRM